MSSGTTRGAGLLGVVALALMWGLNWPSVRLVLFEVPPWTMRLLGMGFGMVVMFGLAIAFGQRLRLSGQELARVLFAGAFNVTAFNLILTFAQLQAPTSRAVIVTFTMSIWTVIFARIFLGERLNANRWAGIAIGTLGLICLGLPLLQAGTFSIGLLLALLAGICFALGAIIVKLYPVQAPPMTMVGYQLAAGTVCALLGVIAFEPQTLSEGIGFADWHPMGWLGLFHHVVFSQALAYIVWYKMMQRLPASTVSLALLMVPAVGVISSVLALGEIPTATDWLGLVLMTLAAAAVVLPARKSG